MSSSSTSSALTARSVLITGCSVGGIGSALAEEFQQQGLHVFATARTLSKMSHLEQFKNVTILELDVVSPSSIAAAVEIVQATTGGMLDYLVNNSDICMVMPALDVDINEAKKVFDVNIWGVMALTQALAPLIIAARGTIVNISSVAGYTNFPWMSVYSASKAALMTYSETLRLEMAPFGVRVISLIKGAVGSRTISGDSLFTLPEKSLYWRAERAISASLDSLKSNMTVEDFAHRVVRDILGKSNGRILRGRTTYTIRCILKVLPTSSMDRKAMEGAGLNFVP